jgi:hypothetical protein
VRSGISLLTQASRHLHGGHLPPYIQPILTLWGSGFLAADLERVIADMRLQLAEVIRHDPSPCCGERRTSNSSCPSSAVRRRPSVQLIGLYSSADVAPERHESDRLAVNLAVSVLQSERRRTCGCSANSTRATE